MTDALTRRQLLRRAAAGGAFLTVPGVLAACGGTTKKSAATNASKTLAKTLRFSNWTLYIDIDEKTKRHPSLDQFQKKTGVHVAYTEDITTMQRTSGRSRARCHAASRSIATSS